MDDRDRFRGCLLGGAVGDALGAAVEFMHLDDIHRQYGPKGISCYAEAYGRLGAITDDTQMTLFTAEGLIRALVRERFRGITTYSGVTAGAYQRWLLTQGEKNRYGIDPIGANPGWLYGVRELHSRRAPGATCLAALRDMRGYDQDAINDSKGCGGVMRVAPVGLFADDLDSSFELGCDLAALTHGHPTGQVASGAFAAMITAMKKGAMLPEAVSTILDILSTKPGHEETKAAIQMAAELSTTSVDPRLAIQKIGEGWIAEEALAIGVYCALSAQSFREALIIAVNHSGDSDSTGAITGNLLGVISGESSIPSGWLDSLELKHVIAEVADDLHDCRNWAIGEYLRDQSLGDIVWDRYPGG